jgi:hypothetical protein
MIERVRARSRALIGVVALLVLASCTADGSTLPEPAGTSTVGATPPAPTTGCALDDGTAAGLEPLLTDKVPAGYEVAPDGAEDTGPTDLRRAAFFVGGPDEGRVLSALRFRGGFQRLWYGPDRGDRDLIVHLYEFCDAQGAAGYLRHTRDRLVSPSWHSVEIAVAGLPEGGVALLQAGDAGGGSFVATLQVERQFYVEIGAYGGPPEEPLDALSARARDLGGAQVGALP